MYCFQGEDTAEFTVEYLDQVMCAGKEDANNTFQALTLGVEHFMNSHRNKNWAFIKTDGASCYSQQEFARLLATMYDITGMQVRGHFLGEVLVAA